MNNFLTTLETAEALRLKASTIRKWIKQGLIHSVRIGHQHLIPKKELMRLTEAAHNDMGQGSHV